MNTSNISDVLVLTLIKFARANLCILSLPVPSPNHGCLICSCSLPKDLYYDQDTADKDRKDEEAAKKKANRPSEFCSGSLIAHIDVHTQSTKPSLNIDRNALRNVCLENCVEHTRSRLTLNLNKGVSF